MFIATTSEIRWFGRGKVPGEVDLWLQNLQGNTEAQTPRTDVYLNIKETPNLRRN